MQTGREPVRLYLSSTEVSWHQVWVDSKECQTLGDEIDQLHDHIFQLQRPLLPSDFDSEQEIETGTYVTCRIEKLTKYGPSTFSTL